jgi:hypothetical protein
VLFLSNLHILRYLINKFVFRIGSKLRFED